jgi:hypothetical protein
VQVFATAEVEAYHRRQSCGIRDLPDQPGSSCGAENGIFDMVNKKALPYRCDVCIKFQFEASCTGQPPLDGVYRYRPQINYPARTASNHTILTLDLSSEDGCIPETPGPAAEMGAFSFSKCGLIVIVLTIISCSQSLKGGASSVAKAMEFSQGESRDAELFARFLRSRGCDAVISGSVSLRLQTLGNQTSSLVCRVSLR